MKNFLSKFKWFITGGVVATSLLIGGIVYAVNVTVPQATQVGDLVKGLSTGNYTLLHPGSTGQVLTVVGGVPAWAAATGSTASIIPLIANGTVAGVNATNATSSLLVEGTGTLNPFNVASSTGSSLLTVLANGNVGIGVTVPAYPLDVATTQTNGAVFSNDGTFSGSTGILNVYKSDASTNDVLFDIGSDNQNNQFVIKDGKPLSLSFYGLIAGGLNIGLAGAGKQISTTNSTSQYLDVDSATNNDNMIMRTAIGQGAILLNPMNVTMLTASSTQGILIDGAAANGTLSVQGIAGNYNVVNFASSSGTSVFSIAPNGSTTIPSLGAGCVNSTSGGALFVATCASGGSSTGTSTQVAYFNASNALTSTPNFTFDNTDSALALGSSGVNGVLYAPNALKIIGNGSATSTTANSIVIQPGELFLNPNSATQGVTITNSSGGESTLVSQGDGGGDQDFFDLPNRSGTSDVIATLGTLRGTAPISYSSISGTFSLNTVPASSGGTGTSTAPTVTGQLLAADGTGTKYAPTNLVAGSNVTITTSTPGQITIAASGGGGLSGGVIGQNAYWTGATSLGASGDVYDNGTVAGVNATSSTINYDIQGTNTNNAFNVASSSGRSILEVLPTNGILLSQNASTTNSSSSVASTVPVLDLGSALSSPSANGTYIGINTPSSFSGNFMQFQNNGGSAFGVANSGQITAAGLSMTSGNGLSLGSNTANATFATNGGNNDETGVYKAFNIAETQGNYNNTTNNLSFFTFVPYSGSTGWNTTAAVNQMWVNVDPIYSGNGTTQAQTNAYAFQVAPFYQPAAGTLVTGRWVGEENASRLGNGGDAYDATTSAGGLMTAEAIEPIINVETTSTEPYSALVVNPYEISTSTLTNYLAVFQVASSTKVAITDAGNLGIGTTTPNQALAVIGTIQQSTEKSCATGLTSDASGNINGCVASDERLKTGIINLGYDPSILQQIQPVTYYWKPGEDKDTQQHAGFIAQEVAKVIPQCEVSAGADTFGVDANCMTAELWLQVQNLKVPQAAKDAQDKWQDILIGLLIIYACYNEVDKRRKK